MVEPICSNPFDLKQIRLQIPIWPGCAKPCVFFFTRRCPFSPQPSFMRCKRCPARQHGVPELPLAVQLDERDFAAARRKKKSPNKSSRFRADAKEMHSSWGETSSNVPMAHVGGVFLHVSNAWNCFFSFSFARPWLDKTLFWGRWWFPYHCLRGKSKGRHRVSDLQLPFFLLGEFA